ncbi:MAG: hypothetical protein E7629_01555 [Ruminococcaceae bacterium]|nr:hypothetical protein [Oscillospiraceae bacterium]
MNSNQLHTNQSGSAPTVLSERAGIGACMDVKAHGGRIYAIQRACEGHTGRLSVLNEKLELLATYEGLGHTRQIEMIGNVAVISAREDGLWFFDVSEITPRLLCHYRTVEFATGVALYGNLAFISCRHYGVEILDISDPTAPRYVGLVRVGEVQSATVSDGILYCGAWGQKKVVIVDIHDPSKPTVLSEIPLQGRGDGVHVKNGILYAATGQHARNLVKKDPSDPAFGRGNGVEIFDVRDPKNPVQKNGIIFERAYCETMDMWEPSLYGDTLVVNNSILGVFGLDPETLETRFRFVPPADCDPNAVTGATVLNGNLFVASCVDLFAVRGLKLGDTPLNRTDVFLPTALPALSFEGHGATLKTAYVGDFSVLSMDANESLLALACAEGGVHLLDKKTLERRAIIQTADQALDVKLHKNRLFVAEGIRGVEIFELDGFSAKRIGGFAAGKSINQIALSDSGGYLLCGIGCYEMGMYDVSDPESVKPLYGYTVAHGIFYGNNFASKNLADGTMVAFCFGPGLLTTNPDKGDFTFHAVKYTPRSRYTEEGVETDGESILYTDSNSYVFISPKHENLTNLNDLPHYRVGEGFTGLLTMNDRLLIASHRPAGRIWAADISNLQAPKLLAKLDTNVSPGKAVIDGDRILIPSGRIGLLQMKLR